MPTPSPNKTEEAEQKGVATARPWVARLTDFNEIGDFEQPYWLVLAADENANEGDALICSVNTLDGADAEFIVRACNSHDDLVAALQLALGEAESWIHDQLDGTSMVDGALARLDPARRALSLALGESK